jgi:hypothetical protein
MSGQEKKASRQESVKAIMGATGACFEVAEQAFMVCESWEEAQEFVQLPANLRVIYAARRLEDLLDRRHAAATDVEH